jgi:biopolymer transport protein ExbB/TolQ
LSTLTLIAALEDDLGDALARIASALRIPVLLAALLVLLASALEVGRFVMELIRRGLPGGRTPLAALAHRAEAEPENARELARQAPSRPSEQAVLQLAEAASSGNDKVAAEHALADYELAVQRRLDHTRIIVRAGPAIGLMGTLIPLAPGLAALGRGDLPQLASDLRTAFAATVIGLLAGTVAFALTLTRTRIYSEDLTALERAAAAIGTKPPPPVPTPREKKRERAEKERAEKEKAKAEKEKAEQEAAGKEAPQPAEAKPAEAKPEGAA